ncbi:MAG TPA: hypothetical protein V6D17_07970 [Candidatus Obscuribacterales bacterium]
MNFKRLENDKAESKPTVSTEWALLEVFSMSAKSYIEDAFAQSKREDLIGQGIGLRMNAQEAQLLDLYADA